LLKVEQREQVKQHRRVRLGQKQQQKEQVLFVQ
jgi:hypothetical protein